MFLEWLSLHLAFRLLISVVSLYVDFECCFVNVGGYYIWLLVRSVISLFYCCVFSLWDTVECCV